MFIQVREPLLIKGQRVNRPVGGDYRPPVPPRRRGWGGGGGSEVRVVNRDSRNTHTHAHTRRNCKRTQGGFSGIKWLQSDSRLGFIQGDEEQEVGATQMWRVFHFFFVFSMGQVINQASSEWRVCTSVMQRQFPTFISTRFTRFQARESESPRFRSFCCSSSTVVQKPAFFKTHNTNRALFCCHD